MKKNKTGKKPGVGLSLTVGTLSVFLAASFMTSCNLPDAGNSNSSSSGSACHTEINKIIQPKIEANGHSLYFNSSDFAFLSDPGFKLTGIDLQVELQGHSKNSKLNLDLNGVLGTSDNGYNYYSEDKY